MRSKNGITLIALVVTIVVLLILAGITITGSMQGIDSSKDNTLLSNLNMVQHAISERRTKYKLTKDTSLLVGDKVADINSISGINWKVYQFDSVDNAEKEYYRLNKSHLQKLGLGSDVSDSATYIVNYYTEEVYNETDKTTSDNKPLYVTNQTNQVTEIGDDIIKDGLLVWYDAINNTGNGHNSNTTVWKDLSGNGRDGIMKDVTIRSNYATFGGSRVDLGYMNDFTNKITLEATIDISQIVAGNCSIICNYESGGVGLKLSYGKPSFMIYLKGVGYVECISNDTLSLNNKYHIVGVYDGLNINLYINGIKPDNNIIRKWPSNNSVVLDSPKTIQPPYSDKFSMIIGADPEQNGYTGYFNGNIYDVRIYNEALSEDEIHHNYLIDKTKYGIEE